MTRFPTLILTPAIQRDAFTADLNRALRTNRRDVPRIHAEARKATTAALRRAVARQANVTAG